MASQHIIEHVAYCASGGLLLVYLTVYWLTFLRRCWIWLRIRTIGWNGRTRTVPMLSTSWCVPAGPLNHQNDPTLNNFTQPFKKTQNTEILPRTVPFIKIPAIFDSISCLLCMCSLVYVTWCHLLWCISIVCANTDFLFHWPWNFNHPLPGYICGHARAREIAIGCYYTAVFPQFVCACASRDVRARAQLNCAYDNGSRCT